MKSTNRIVVPELPWKREDKGHGFCSTCGASLYPIASDILTCRRGHHWPRAESEEDPRHGRKKPKRKKGSQDDADVNPGQPVGHGSENTPTRTE